MPTDVRIVQVDARRCRVEGAVTYETARTVHAATSADLAAAFEQAPEGVEIDMSGVTSGNSLLLSLMLTWLRQARQQERRVSFGAVPAQLLELIRFTGLDGILPIAREPAA